MPDGAVTPEGLKGLFYFMEIEKLNELDSLELLQRIGEHLRKNDMEHLIDDVFTVDDNEDELHQLRQEVDDLEKENRSLEDDHATLFAKIDEAISKIKELQDQPGVPDGYLDELLKTLE